jgi:hypothetical protein
MAREYQAATLMKTVVISTASTSTVSAASVDLGPYFSVGRREIKFLVTMLNSLSSSTGGVIVSIVQSDSTLAANSTVVLTAIPGYDGSSAVFTSTQAGTYATEWHGLVTSRHVQARVVGTSSTDVSGWAVAVVAFPRTRAA